MIEMSFPYGDCYYCGGEVTEKIIDIDYRWEGQLYIIKKVPVGVCNQCGEKFFTAEVSSAIDEIVKSKEIKEKVEVPVKEFKVA